MMTLDQIKAALGDRRLDRVATATGIHYNTVRNIASGKTTNPSWETIRRLSNYLSKTQEEA